MFPSPFQSTPPLQGATGILRELLFSCLLHFNPRTPRGVRHGYVDLCKSPQEISIHAPLAGCPFFPGGIPTHRRRRTHPVSGKNAHIPGDEEVSPALGKSTVVGVFVKDRSVGGAEIFRPLVLDIDKRPLAAAELEVLQTGELEEILLGINHPIRVQVTPSGSFSSSTVTA